MVVEQTALAPAARDRCEYQSAVCEAGIVESRTLIGQGCHPVARAPTARLCTCVQHAHKSRRQSHTFTETPAKPSDAVCWQCYHLKYQNCLLTHDLTHELFKVINVSIQERVVVEVNCCMLGHGCVCCCRLLVTCSCSAPSCRLHSLLVC